jgi:hypothetical protein
MRRRNEPKPIQGWGWLGDAAEEAAVQAMVPARRLKNARANMAAMKAKKKSAAGTEHVPTKPSSSAQVSDDEYRRLAKQQYESEGEIEIDAKARVSRSEDHTGEIGAYVQAWVFVYKPERT